MSRFIFYTLILSIATLEFGTAQISLSNKIAEEINFLDCIEKQYYCGQSTIKLHKNNCGQISDTFDPLVSSLVIWRAKENNILEFSLSSSFNQDVDFILYEVHKKEYKPLRIMLSGENKGRRSKNKMCTGPTGLRLGETDIQELPGCSSGDNNFLKEVHMEKGKTYALLIFSYEQIQKLNFESNVKHTENYFDGDFYVQNSFLYCNQAKNPQNLSWKIRNESYGDYPLNTQDLYDLSQTILELNYTTNEGCNISISGSLNSTNNNLEIYPNPSTNMVYLKLNNYTEKKNIVITIYNSSNKIVFEKLLHNVEINQIISLNIDHLASGNYFVVVKNPFYHQNVKFIKI